MIYYQLRVARKGNQAGRTIAQACQAAVVPRIGEALIVQDTELGNDRLDDYLCHATVTMVEHEQTGRVGRHALGTIYAICVYARENG